MGKYSKGIRKLKFTCNNKRCYICDNYEHITELHHLVKVSDISKYIDKVEEDNIINRVLRGVYLCPNHHTLLHKLMSKKYLDVIFDLSTNEVQQYYILLEYTKQLYVSIYEYINNQKSETTFDILKLKVHINQVCSMLKKIMERRKAQ